MLANRHEATAGGLGRGLTVVLLALLLVTGGWLARPFPAAQAEVREETSRSQLRSGAARNEAIQREMLATLKSIDARLARLEALAAGAAEE